MKILALETATSACSAALWKDGSVAARRLEGMARGQSEALMGMVGGVLDEAECAFSDLDLLAVTVGPGAFTGLRIGLAAARGFAVAQGLPCLGVTTLETVAHQVPEDERDGKTLLVVLETKREDIYAQAFDAGLKPLGKPEAAPPGGLARLLPAGPVLLAGDAALRALEELRDASLSAAPGFPDAAAVAEIASRRWRPGEALCPPAPLYLRPPDASIPKNGGRLRP
ncbi:MAG TPA: tRNA (adenosine(37)-N6)-threonylcarbamoyltransferase complex dimerization subunit type 1 TsaB [Rhodospirillales bacterium]|nr:tRNA (adenosine(37)-N6)-threonylcarbamoyltransferase complex dimerization subunit type 1 TsaB [Rhodospirillales bacterium]